MSFFSMFSRSRSKRTPQTVFDLNADKAAADAKAEIGRASCRERV